MYMPTILSHLFCHAQMRHLAGETGDARTLKHIFCGLDRGNEWLKDALIDVGFVHDQAVTWDQCDNLVLRSAVRPMDTPWCHIAAVAGVATDAMWEGLPGEGDDIWYNTPLKRFGQVVDEWYSIQEVSVIKNDDECITSYIAEP